MPEIAIAEHRKSVTPDDKVGTAGQILCVQAKAHSTGRERFAQQDLWCSVLLAIRCPDSAAVAEFPYQPTACARPYRMVVVRKNISVEQGDQRLFDQIRYFFYLTNDRETATPELVFLANDRCNQENLIEQLKHGVGATRMPVDTLLSNWAYMVMAALAWSLKAWFALLLPETGRWAARYTAEKAVVLRMEFPTFLNAFMRIPVQVVRTSRRLVFRLLAWNPWQAVFLRAFDHLREPLRC